MLLKMGLIGIKIDTIFLISSSIFDAFQWHTVYESNDIHFPKVYSTFNSYRLWVLIEIGLYYSIYLTKAFSYIQDNWFHSWGENRVIYDENIPIMEEKHHCSVYFVVYFNYGMFFFNRHCFYMLEKSLLHLLYVIKSFFINK